MPDESILETGDLSPLLEDGRTDPFGYPRPPLDSRVIRLAAQMASSAYALDAEPFLASGWQDVCAQLGPKVTDGVSLSADGLRALRGAQRRLGQSRRGLINLREWRSRGGVKTVVMLNRLPDGRFLVAISFLGSIQLDDWVANFDMVTEGGIHRGFLRRAMAFEEAEESIDFPQAAEQLGVKRLSLRQAVEACARDGSPFRLFLTGHSLGAAVMQVYVHQLLTRRGVRRELVQGVGFASPTVMRAGAVEDPADWPLCHVLNSDDCIPRLGAQIHLGLCLRYPADDNLRAACYRFPQDRISRTAQTILQPLLDMVKDTASGIAVCCGVVEAVKDGQPADFLPAVRNLTERWPVVQRIADAGDVQGDRLLAFAIRRMKAVSASASGHKADPMVQHTARIRFRAAVDLQGYQGALNTLVSLSGQPHAMRRPEGEEAVYTWIACRPLNCFTPFVWEPGEEARERLSP